MRHLHPMLLGLVAPLVACGGSDSPTPPETSSPETQTDDPADDAPEDRTHEDDGPDVEALGDDDVPWATGDGPTTTIPGRVVDPSGDAVAGVEVELVYGGDPHYPEAVGYRTRSGDDGAFSFRGVSPYGNWVIVVRHEGAARTFSLPSAEPDVTERPPVEIRIGPMREVPMSLRCREAPRHPRSEYDTTAMQLTIAWLPVGDVVVRTSMGATDGTEDPLNGRGDPGWSQVMPGRSMMVPRIPRDARRFASTPTLPVGRHRVTIQGPCGVLNTEIEVPPGDGAAPEVSLEAPVPDHSELVLMLASDSSRDRVFPRVSLEGTRLRHDYELRRGTPMRFPRVAPGRYTVDDVTCHEPIEVPPRSVTGVTIGPGRCEVRSRSR